MRAAILLSLSLVATLPSAALAQNFPATGKQLLEVLDAPKQYSSKKTTPQRAGTTIAVEGYVWGIFQALLLTQNACIVSATANIESPQEVFDKVRDFLKSRPMRLNERAPDLVIAAVRDGYPCK